MQPVYLIDASVYIFRAHFSLPPSLTDSSGQPFNAAYGFAGFLCDLLERTRPKAVAVAFDESLSTSFRNDIYPAYKANREPAPPELKRQFGACAALTRAAGLLTLSSPVYEADDLIGTLAERARNAGQPVTIVSRDKDLAQLLGADDILWDYAADKRYDGAAVARRFGVAPAQIADYLALIGDTVDNIPGVPGIGPKTAASLLGHFPDLDTLLANLDAVESLPIRGARSVARRLRDGADQARLALQLTLIPRDAPLPPEAEDTCWRPPEAETLGAWCEQAGLGDRLRRRLTGLPELWRQACGDA